MGLLKAKTAFYNDKVGSRAQNEIFEVTDEKVCAELEQKGFVQKVSGQEAQAHQEQQKSQEQVGQRNALTNEAVSMAHHVQNKQAQQDQQAYSQIRQQQAAHAQQMASQGQGAQMSQQQHEALNQANKAKKGDR